MTTFVPVIHKNQPAPARYTTPGSDWRKQYEAMNVGDWFEVPRRFYARVSQSANKFLKGRYTLYLHPNQSGDYIFQRIK